MILTILTIFPFDKRRKVWYIWGVSYNLLRRSAMRFYIKTKKAKKWASFQAAESSFRGTILPGAGLFLCVKR